MACWGLIWCQLQCNSSFQSNYFMWESPVAPNFQALFKIEQFCAALLVKKIKALACTAGTEWICIHYWKFPGETKKKVSCALIMCKSYWTFCQTVAGRLLNPELFSHANFKVQRTSLAPAVFLAKYLSFNLLTHLRAVAGCDSDTQWKPSF